MLSQHSPQPLVSILKPSEILIIYNAINLVSAFKLLKSGHERPENHALGALTCM